MPSLILSISKVYREDEQEGVTDDEGTDGGEDSDDAAESVEGSDDATDVVDDSDVVEASDAADASFNDSDDASPNRPDSGLTDDSIDNTDPAASPGELSSFADLLLPVNREPSPPEDQSILDEDGENIDEAADDGATVQPAGTCSTEEIETCKRNFAWSGDCWARCKIADTNLGRNEFGERQEISQIDNQRQQERNKSFFSGLIAALTGKSEEADKLKQEYDEAESVFQSNREETQAKWKLNTEEGFIPAGECKCKRDPNPFSGFKVTCEDGFKESQCAAIEWAKPAEPVASETPVASATPPADTTNVYVNSPNNTRIKEKDAQWCQSKKIDIWGNCKRWGYDHYQQQNTGLVGTGGAEKQNQPAAAPQWPKRKERPGDRGFCNTFKNHPECKNIIWN